VAERILPWVTASAAIIGIVFGLWQYVGKNQAERVARVVELHRAYVGSSGKEPIYEAWTKHIAEATGDVETLRCEFILKLVQTGEVADSPETADCSNDKFKNFVKSYNLSSVQRQKFRQILYDRERAFFDGDTAASNDFYRIRAFFHEIVVCVDEDACDRNASINFFAVEMLQFLNDACPLFEASKWNLNTPDLAIAKFIVESDLRKEIVDAGNDPNRESIFFCDFYRSLDKP
jgi:hypothetical protein